MVRWVPLAVALAAGACSASDTDAALALAPGDCAAADFADVSVLSIEVYGRDAGALCVLRQRCIFNVDAMSVDELGDAMAEVSQPLIDVGEDDGAMVLAVIGHTDSCFRYDDQALCGFADLADADDGTLDVALQCTDCPTAAIPFCP